MKKRFLFISIQLVLFLSSAAQDTTYHKFVKDGVSWVIDEWLCGDLRGCDPGSFAPYYYNTHYYKLEGDTSIENIIYSKLYLSSLISCPQCGPPYGPPVITFCGPYQLYGLLREDTTTKKVFWRLVSPEYCDKDSLFMDFSITAPDSFQYNYTADYCVTNAFVVDSINFVGFKNRPVKTKYIRNTALEDNYWGIGETIKLYEGIGYSFGFKMAYNSCDGVCYSSELVNYCEAGDSSCASPLLPNSVEKLSVENITVSIQPNPTTDFVSVSSLSQIRQVEIFNLEGQKLLTSTSTQLNVSSLPPAIYIAITYTHEGLVYRKLVKQ